MPTVNKTGFILKTLPAGVEKSPDNGVWFCASYEDIDSDGDIIRIDGLSLEEHRPESPVKILAQHLRRLADGSSPVVGKIEEFKKATLDKGAGHKKALLGRMSFAPTELAQGYKKLVEAGYVDSFSIGASVLEAKPIKGKGNDYTKTILREVSLVTIPANSNATVLRAIEDTLGDHLDKSNTFAFTVKMDPEAIAILKRLESWHGSISETINNLQLAFNKRFDDFESAYVAKSEEGSLTGDRTEPAQDINWDAVVSSLKSLSQKR